MFFRRDKIAVVPFAAHLDLLRGSGFQVENLPGGGARVRRNECAVDVVENDGGKIRVSEAGIILDDELAELTDLGYQKIFLAPSGKKIAAVAAQLHALHALEEDVRESLGIDSLYNQSLGTTNEKHLYDRVENRDAGVPRRPWER